MTGRLPLNSLSNSKINAINSSSPTKNRALLKKSSLYTDLATPNGTNGTSNGGFFRTALSRTDSSSSILTPTTHRPAQPSVLASSTHVKMRLPSISLAIDSLPPLAHSVSNTDSFIDSLTFSFPGAPSNVGGTTTPTDTPTTTTNKTETSTAKETIPRSQQTQQKQRQVPVLDMDLVCEKLQVRMALALYKYNTSTTRVRHLVQKTVNSDCTPKKGKKKTVGLHRTTVKSVTPSRAKAARSLLKLCGSTHS